MLPKSRTPTTELAVVSKFDTYLHTRFSFLVGGNGKVYQGGGWLHVGAHTFGYNRRSIGISFIGDFRTKEPTAAALQAVQRLLECGVNKNYLARDYHLVGHKQLIATESPGTSLYNLITDWPHWTRDVSAIAAH
ncbi:Peptidoglycan recognition protein [Eumeta japonica]|uniref:Peptidoglycan recognition protein n=1 Tax=Eumeta variegata TaxID=151549 RepID=A0A4C1TTR4_EUMVA|nr:Peptidoglycan recognition protein [Eumeta japonica]